MTFQAVRLEKTCDMAVPASCEEVFPLLCPVREYEWLPYWSCEMLYSESGLAEPGCVFRTDFPGRGKMTWTVTRYEPPTRVQYTVFKPGSHVWNLEITLEPREPGRTALAWRHTFTGLTEEGNAFLSQYSDEEHRGQLAHIERALVHFIETGEMLRG